MIMSKRLKVFISIVAVFVLSAVFCVFSQAENETSDAVTEPDLKIRVGLFDASEAYTEIQRVPGEQGDQYVLFLPSGCDRNNLRLIFDYKQLAVDSKPVKSGDVVSVFAEDKTVKIKTETKEFDVRVCSSEKLPAVFINTESGGLDKIHADKKYKEKATLTLTDGGKTVLNGSALSHIKGGESSSWNYNEKRSYNIKFAENTEILGMAAAKKWALVSNSMDPTLMRNAIAYTAAQMTNLPYTVDFRFVDLYINGNYRGNYMLCEKIEIGKNRININDLEKANEKANPGIDLDAAEKVEDKTDGKRLRWFDLPADPADISGGYLIEFGSEKIIETDPTFIASKNDFYLSIKSPQHITQNEIKYISSLYDEFEQALLSADGKNSKGKSFMDYIDVDSFVEAAVIFEFFENGVHGSHDFYVFLPEGSDKFVAGPLWDFDKSMKDAAAVPEALTVLAGKDMDGNRDLIKDWEAIVLLQMLSKREFFDLAAKRALELCDLFKTQLNDKTNAMFDDISSSAKCDRLRWNYEITDEADVNLTSYVLKRVKTVKKYYSHINASIRAEARNIRIAENPGAIKKQVFIIISVSVAAVIAIVICVSAVRRKRRHRSKLK